MRTFTHYFCIVVLAVTAGRVQATPTEDLLKLAPENTSFCIVIQNMRDHSQRLIDSPFGKSIQQSEWAKSITTSHEWSVITAVNKLVCDQLGTTVKEIRNDIIGDSVVFAYQPARNPQDRDTGVFLIHARDPEKLAKLVERFNKLQTDAGEVLEITEKQVDSVKYWIRKKAKNSSDGYYIQGNTLAFSAQDSVIREIAERAAKPTKLAYFPTALSELGFQKAGIALLIAPRSIDGELKKRIQSTQDPETRAIVGKFSALWESLDAVGMGIHLDTKLDVTIGTKYNAQRMPKEFQGFLKPPEPASLWASIPDDAFLAAAGSLNFQQTYQFLLSILGETGQAQLKKNIEQGVGAIVGKDLLPEIMKTTGGNWAFWMNPPQDPKGADLPQATVIIQVAEANARNARTRSAIANGMEFLFQSLRVNYNSTHDDQIELKELGSTKYLENVNSFPPGVKPAFCLKEKHLLLGTSPTILDKATIRQDKPAEDGLLLRLKCDQFAKYLQNSRLDETVAKLTRRDVVEVKKEFAGLISVLEHFKTWEIHYAVTNEVVTLTWRVETAKPMK